VIETYKKTELEKLIRAHRLRPSKFLGQNFLTDRNIAEKIVRSLNIAPEDRVVEIGPGAGALTVLLAQLAGRVTAVELDRRIMPALREATEGLPAIGLVNEDFLKFDVSAGQAAGEGTAQNAGAFKIVGNLPYYITTAIIAKLYEPPKGGLAPSPPALAVFMVQKEVAERLISPPGKKTYGAISVLVQYYTEAELLFEVSREVFTPKPGVDSAVIRLTPRDLSADDPEASARMFRLVRAGFDMRRKTLRNSFASAGFSEAALLAALETAGIDPIRRAETLSPRDFYAVAKNIPAPE
jgi:16S rRNA (adenine1518-N6/adenine1519-N6)-dimethyltransferase